MVGVEVEVIEGTLRGRVVTSHPDKTYYSFQGVPYAKPPVGELRFKSPRAPDPWKGIRDATTEGSMCLQFKDELEGSEDCLYLNIYTPKLPGQDGGTLQPVMVFIHGGGLYFGSGNADRYGPGHLVDAGVILVTLNYRLGILGEWRSKGFSIF
uniref:Carboxylesterase type B domain-containing protein n=1 Tax=Timema poppense TaxID=170557 RepID=A0A7R9DQK2_TIMPO|nr:unnamed protein product [Timema poppensis]